MNNPNFEERFSEISNKLSTIHKSINTNTKSGIQITWLLGIFSTLLSVSSIFGLIQISFFNFEQKIEIENNQKVKIIQVKKVGIKKVNDFKFYLKLGQQKIRKINLIGTDIKFSYIDIKNINSKNIFKFEIDFIPTDGISIKIYPENQLDKWRITNIYSSNSNISSESYYFLNFIYTNPIFSFFNLIIIMSIIGVVKINYISVFIIWVRFAKRLNNISSIIDNLKQSSMTLNEFISPLSRETLEKYSFITTEISNNKKVVFHLSNHLAGFAVIDYFAKLLTNLFFEKIELIIVVNNNEIISLRNRGSETYLFQKEETLNNSNKA